VDIYEPEASMDTSKDWRFEANWKLTLAFKLTMSLEQSKKLIVLAAPLPPYSPLWTGWWNLPTGSFMEREQRQNFEAN
jgi:hypothetical protein